MKRPFLTAISLVFIASVSLSAAEAPKPFEVILVPTIQYGYEDMWRCTPSAGRPHFAVVSKVVRKQPVRLLIFFGGYAINGDSRADVTFDVSVTRPDGSSYFQRADLVGVANTRVAPQLILLAQDLLSFTAEDRDALGNYVMHVVARDRIGSVRAEERVTITVVEAGTIDRALPAGFNAGSWMTGYLKDPQPHLALPALLATADDPKMSGKSAEDHGVLLGFYEQILHDNPWLVPQFIAQLTVSTGEQQRLLALVLTFAFRGDLGFFEQLSPDRRRIVREHSQVSFPIPKPEPTRGSQLDVLWGNFFATGRLAPMKELVAILRYYPFRDELKAFSKLENKPKPPPPEVLKSVAFGAAAWSIDSNVRQHALVREYCAYLFDRGELEVDSRGVLGEILRRATENEARPTSPDPAEKKQE